MKTLPQVISSLFVLASATAMADGGGSYFESGKETKLVDAYAFHMDDPFEKGKQITRIVFSDRDIDENALNNASDRDDAIGDQLRGGLHIELNLDANGEMQNLNVMAPGSSGSTSGSGWYTLDIKRNDAQRVEGSFRSNDESEKANGRYYELNFALDIPGAPDLGEALPAGGGEPGKVYLSHLASLHKGDIDAMLKTMTKQRADELAAHRNDAEFKMMFGFIQSSAIRDPKYVSGHVSGDSATLEYTGKNADGGDVATTVSMKREGGAWKVEKESSKSSM